MRRVPNSRSANPQVLPTIFAPRFYEAVTSMNLGSIEALLERNGYSVKQLSCYRALTAS